MSATSFNLPLLRLVWTGSSEPRTWISQHLGEIGAAILLCGGVLAPQWEVSPTEPRIRRELFILVAIILAYGWMLLSGKAKQARMRMFYLIGIVFSLCVGLSTAYGAQILHHSISIRDFSEIPKSWLPMLFFAVGYGAQISESGVRRLLNYLAIAAFLICLFGWGQFFDWRITAILTPYYGDGAHNDYTLKVYHRIYSTLTNPNVLSQFLSWTIILYVMALVFGIGNRFRNMFVPAFCLVNIVLTGSRYGILSVVFGFLFIVPLASKARRGLSRVLGLVMLFLVFSVIFAVVSQRGSFVISKRFDELRDPMRASSLRGRLDFLWIEAAQDFLSSPVLGHGPVKIIYGHTYTDSEYLDILKMYGLVGFTVYSLYYWWPLHRIRLGMRDAKGLPQWLEEELGATLLVVRFGFAMLAMALFMNIGMFTFLNWYLMCFMWTWTGLSVRASEAVSEAAELARVPAAHLAPRPLAGATRPDLAINHS